MMRPLTSPLHLFRVFVSGINQRINMGFSHLTRIRLVGLITGVIIDKIRLIPVVFTAHPRRAHAARATPPRPRKALAVRGGARSKTGSWEHASAPPDERYTSARHAQDRTAASALPRAPRARRPKTADT